LKKTILNRLLKVGSYSELFGLFSGYDLKKVTDQIKTWGLAESKLWSNKAIETILEPFRIHSRQQNLSEKTIDKALSYFAETTKIDTNLVRRVYWGVASSEPKEKPEEKTEEIIEEAEEDLSEFEDEDEEEETVEETDTE